MTIIFACMGPLFPSSFVGGILVQWISKCRLSPKVGVASLTMIYYHKFEETNFYLATKYI